MSNNAADTIQGCVFGDLHRRRRDRVDPAPMKYPDPPDCQHCGQPLTVLNWCDVTRWGELRPRFIPGQSRCDTPDCLDANDLKADDRAWIKRVRLNL